ncbi:MAG TPA: hypothetical protein VFS20_14965 [Longimicrobium sp.]|nr:hypothetical protein [Longimicrobium sp.]
MYVVEVKSSSEGRSDRLIPLWSQAYLQALRVARDPRSVLVVVAAPRISPRVARQVLEFAAEHAPEAAVGVIDHAGLRIFRGEGLRALDAEPPAHERTAPVFEGRHANLFSDLNQWMLKVLLAPELPEALLSAPRGRYLNATQLAAAAEVSVMSASRLVRQLRHERYLHESKPHLELVRRGDLFRRWRNAAVRRPREVALRWLLRGDPSAELKRLAQMANACLALFSAADALGAGFVSGVPPCLYVRHPELETISRWKTVVPAQPHEPPDVVVREAPFPESVFRAAVSADGTQVSDILQVWLDVAAHPARGDEQAGHIRREILAPVIGDDLDG